MPVSSLFAGGNDRLDLLQTFVRIVEAGSLSAAAASLGTTQPTVSRRLQQLERLLGRRLIHRSTHSMRLSEDGERCYQRAKEILTAWTAFEVDLQGDDAEPEGLLRVFAPHAFGQHLMVGPLAEFMRRYPKVTVEWLLKDYAPNFIEEGVDCAILVGEVRDPLTVAVRLAAVPRIVVCAPQLLEGGEALTDVADLSRLPWLALRTYYYKDVLLQHTPTGKSTRLSLRPRFSTDNLYALRSAALRGLGACVVSSWVVADDLAEGRLVRLMPEWEAAPIPIHLIYPYATHYSPALLRFVQTMRARTAEALGETVLRGK
ncbi:MAG: LysR substrate-binding domain-containing protein [Verrucomicrobiota bacterium JB022]|nr:LysR substrate-binding domain-containing protein [Verrucomicrobiota bacterium JB022]